MKIACVGRLQCVRAICHVNCITALLSYYKLWPAWEQPKKEQEESEYSGWVVDTIIQHHVQ